MGNFVFLLITAIVLLASLLGPQVIIMALISTATVTVIQAKQQSAFAENSNRNVLLGILVLGLIMTSMLGVILLHGAR